MSNDKIALAGNSSAVYAAGTTTKPTQTSSGTPKPENVVVKTSTVDIESKEYQLVLGAIKNHATVVYNTNTTSRNYNNNVAELARITRNIEALKTAKSNLATLKEMEQTKEVIDSIKLLERSIASAETTFTQENKTKTSQLIKEDKENYTRFIEWQKSTLDVYANEVFSSDQMVANYLVALRNFHDEISLFSIFDKKTGKQASFALCRVPVSTMKKFYGDPTWNKPAYVIYPIDTGYKDFNITVQDMATYRETKDQVVTAFAKQPTQTVIPGQFALIDDRDPKMFAAASTTSTTDEGTMLAKTDNQQLQTSTDMQTTAKVTGGYRPVIATAMAGH